MCTSDTFKLKVKPDQMYMLWLINAAFNNELFFSIQMVIVVDVYALYVKPFTVDTLFNALGQNSKVQLTTTPSRCTRRELLHGVVVVRMNAKQG
jgi:hypothetical protein